MKKNIKRSVFSVVLCAMLVFCVSFYSSVEPTTAWYSDTGKQEGSFNMDEISITFVGDGIKTDENNEQISNTIELNFKAATKAVDEDNENNPDEMFEHAAEFYTFIATNNSQGTTAQMRISIETDSESDIGVRYCVYELGPEVNADGVIPLLTEPEAQSDTSVQSETTTLSYTNANWTDVYVDSNGERVIKSIKPTEKGSVVVYCDAYLKESLNNTDVLLLEPGKDNAKTYCIGIWVEYDYFKDVAVANGLRTLECNATVNISAEQYVEAEDSAAE